VKVRWTEYALDQLLVIVDALGEHRSARSQKQILDRLLQRIHVLGDLPWSGPEWRPANDASFRRLVVDEHVVLYRVSESEATVFILAVRHGRQRPLDPEDVPST
jgi:plasmid stabilization system protein ParE